MASTHPPSLEATLLHDLPTPSFVPIRYRPGNLGTWSGHLAFANDLIAALRPGLVVELGTHWGESYFTFCQSAFQNGLDCLCYAVDHWQGEPHAGVYGEEVFQDVHQFNETHYRGFSYLLRTTFDNGALQFANDSIDLLHIDGLHTYEAASHDFHTWLPKVKPGGIILLHDIVVRHADFGVWRLWDELKERFNQTFEFHHWWGLGVVQKPGVGNTQPPLMNLLFRSSPTVAERLRRHYVMHTAYLENTLGCEAKGQPTSRDGSEPDVSQANIQIYSFNTVGYTEESSVTHQISLNQWQDLSLTLPQGWASGPLRIDPSDCVSIIQIRRLTLRDEATGAVVCTAAEAQDFADVQVLGSAIPFAEGGAPFSIFSYSVDPCMVLPSRWQFDDKLQLEISIRVQTELSSIAAALQSATHPAPEETAVQISETTKEEVARLQEALSRSQMQLEEIGRLQQALAESGKQAEEIARLEQALAESGSQAEEIARLQEALAASEGRGAEARTQIGQLEDLLASTTARIRQDMQREVRMLQGSLDAAEDRAREEARKTSSLPDVQKQLQSVQTMMESERAIRIGMQQSKSWTLTKPLRDFARLFKGGR